MRAQIAMRRMPVPVEREDPPAERHEVLVRLWEEAERALVAPQPVAPNAEAGGEPARVRYAYD